MSSNSEDESMELNESSIESDSQLEDENDSNEEENAQNTLEADENIESDSENENQDIDESEDSSDDDENDEVCNEDTSTVKTKEALIREKVINRLKDNIGKQLYIRFNARLPDSEEDFQKQVKSLSPLIVKGIKPRQKHARFCLADFETQKDRDATFVKLRAASNKKEPALKGIVVSIPRTEDEQFVESLIQRRIKAQERKIAKRRLKKTIKQTKKKNQTNFTSTVLVRNLPGNVSKVEMRSLFPKAVDIQVKPLRAQQSSVATITLPTSKDAREAVNQNLSLGGTRLKITFHGGKAKRSKQAAPESTREKEKTHAKPKTKIRKVLCE